MTLQQRRQAAQDVCRTCEHCETEDGTRVDCERAEKPVAYSVGKCPLGMWDHSETIRAEASTYVMICLGQHLKWPVAAWEVIQAQPLIGTKYRVPRDVWERVKDQRYED